MKEFFTSRFQTIQDFFSTQRIPTSDWKNIVSWDYWTESGLPSSSAYTAFTVGIILLLVIGLIIWRIKLLRAHKVTPVYEFETQNLASIITFVIIMCVSYAFFRSQQIAYASSRLVILASLLTTIGWIVIVINHLRRKATKMRVSYLEKERFFRYLPKKRK